MIPFPDKTQNEEPQSFSKPLYSVSSVNCENLACFVVKREGGSNILYYYYYTFKHHSCFLLVDIHQLIFNDRKLWHHFCRRSWIIRRSCLTKKIIGRRWRNHSRPRKLQNSKNGLQQFGKLIARTFTANLFSHLSLFWMYKTIIRFGLRMSRIIQTLVHVTCLSLRLWQITSTSVWIILDIMLSPIQ